MFSCVNACVSIRLLLRYIITLKSTDYVTSDYEILLYDCRFQAQNLGCHEFVQELYHRNRR